MKEIFAAARVSEHREVDIGRRPPCGSSNWMYTFNYHRPANLDETKELLSSLEDPKILAGGMTLLPTMKQRLAKSFRSDRFG